MLIHKMERKDCMGYLEQGVLFDISFLIMYFGLGVFLIEI
jgi:hypothetical protein